jgi:C4-dicarboxylate transporter DctM subunit
MELACNAKSSWKERFGALKETVWGLLAPVFILGGIYGGFVTPTEAAGVAVVYGLFVGMFIYKEIALRDIWRLLVDASVSSAVVMFIIAFAGVFAWLLTSSQIAASLAESMLAISSNKYVLLLVINVILLIAGCFIDAASAYYIFVPIMLPVVRSIGVEPIVFGVFMTVNLAIGMITPPVGLDIFMASNVGGISLKEVSLKVIPFLIASIAALVLITLVPGLSLWLPNFIGIK